MKIKEKQGLYFMGMAILLNSFETSNTYTALLAIILFTLGSVLLLN